MENELNYEQFLELNKDEMIEGLAAVLRCKSEQTEAVKAPRTAGGGAAGAAAAGRLGAAAAQDDEVYPFGEGVQEAFTTFLGLASDMGFETYNADNYGGHVDFPGTGDKILGIIGHLDVVPAAGGWDFDPYGAEVKDGYIYGRGTTDDKGPMVSCLYAMKALKDAGFQPNATIRLIIGLDEETNWKGMDYYFAKSDVRKPDFGFTPDSDFPIINGEKGILVFELARKFANQPSQSKGLNLRSIRGGVAANSVADSCRAVIRNMNADAEPYAKVRDEIAAFREETGYKIRSKGIGKSLEITTEGQSAHGAKPEAGLNAISVMMAFLGRLNFADEEHNDFIDFYNKYIGFCLDGEKLGINFSDEPSGKLVFNVGMAEMNEKAASLTINVRYPVTMTGDDVYEAMADLLEKYNFGVIKEKDQAPIYKELDDPLIKTLLEIYRKHTGDTESEPLVIGGGTYARACDNIVAYGALFPGDPDIMHQKNECLSIERFEQMTKIYAEAIYKLASGEYNN